MYKLIAAILCLTCGIILLLVHKKASKNPEENEAFKTPYLKNGGIGFLFFGVYYLVKFFLG